MGEVGYVLLKLKKNLAKKFYIREHIFKLLKKLLKNERISFVPLASCSIASVLLIATFFIGLINSLFFFIDFFFVCIL